MDSCDKDVKLSAEVEPFIPQKKGLEGALVTMSLSGGEGGGGVEPTPIPSYLITCYPFVQENQPNRQQHPMYSGGGDLRWQQPNPSPGGPYLAYPILSSPQPPVSNDYTYYQIMPAPCPPMMGFYQPFPGTYAGPLQPGVVNTISADVSERPAPLGQQQQVGLCQSLRARRPPMRTVAVQKEVCSSGPDGRTKTVLLVDAAQQTDFPGDNACGRGASEREQASPLLWKNLPRRRRASHPAESSSEADIDSDSGYCSPKHNQQAPGVTQHTAHAAIAPTVGPNSNPVVDPTLYCLSWVNVASQASQRPWSDNRTTPFQRTGKTPDQRNYSQVQWASPEVILTSPWQLKPPSSLQLENLPENSPINIVQTPIPITTSVPKRAKSQRKKALAAALATAQEYSEISMEQRKLQEALTKAAGKKSKTPVQLDLGDMLAALEKQQQAMKARQITNTKPLSFTGTHSGSGIVSMLKAQQAHSAPLNMLDSSAPRLKRGKEREIPKVKRPTALKKIILKEREGKRGKGGVDQIAASQEEQGEEELHFTDDLTREPASQEGRYRVRENGLSVPSDDASLSPASQNSPYSITPVSQGSPGSSGIGSPMASNAITKIHSRRFREYCNQVLNKEIDESVTMLLQELVRFQERVYQKDPSKAKTKRRLVMGLREVTKHMKLHKIKCVLISPNCEKIQAKGGLDEALYNVIAMAREQEIPFVFALGRKALGRCVNKLVPVSVVGVFNFSGAEGLFNRLVSLTEDARKSYKDMVSALEQEQAEEALKNVKKVTHHMGHSRNPSAASAISFCSVISEPISEVNEKEYETNWRSMVESSDGLEPVEAKPSHPAASSGLQRDNQPPSTTTNRSPYSTTLQLRAAVPAPGSGPGEREEGRADDRLELASQQSTETGSLDGSCRDLLNSSITSTTSTLVPGMLEEAEEEEEEEEEYTPEPISVEVPAVISRIESWVSKTLENLQLGKSQDSTEEEEEEEEEGVQSEEEEELDSADVTETGLEKMEANNITG
uniref:SECIS binding protein 2 like n=1 Tax=Oncorhynchus mykiss TaxID=8022 RepID=A0A8K9X301_ONCMY